MFGCAGALAGGILAVTKGAFVDAGETLSAVIAGRSGAGFAAGGAGAAGFTAGPAALAAGFAASFLRSNPRATRNVALACSTLIVLVKTRLAPIRKAFATPACPSTTATASAD